MTASASAIASRRTCRSGEAKPVSTLFVRSCATSRTSMTSTTTSRGASARTVASVRRSASRRVEDGWVTPAVTMAMWNGFTSSPPGGHDGRCGARRGGEQARVGRGIGHVGGLESGELLAEDRHDLLAEDVELLEDGLERQARVVEQPQLALVVTGVLPEAERPLDDLLGASDGQGRLARELLERRAVAVDRGVVEVGPELAHGVLAVLPHEDLPAEAYDGLVGAPVAVVLEPAAVELDHLLRVAGRPEDVVGEEAVAVVGGLLGDLGAADRAVPHEGRYAVERARRRREALERGAVLALPVDDVLAPQAVQQGVVLDRERDAVADVLAEPRVDRAGVAAAHHEVRPAVAQVLERRVVLGDPDRVGRRDEGRRGRQQDPLGLGGDEGERRRGGRRDERRVVVLSGREDVEPDLLRLLGDGDGGLDPLVLGRRTARRGVGGHVADGEDPELHVSQLL